MKRSKAIFIILMVVLSGCRNKPVSNDTKEVIRVRTVPVRSEVMGTSVHSGGIVTTSEEVKLSFKAGGIVSEILVREGVKVKKGDILARLNPSEINENVNIAEKAYEKALRDWTRAKNLYADTVATLELYQNATTALDVAKSTLGIARFNQKHSTITAPEDGMILKQLIRENELVAAGYPIFLFGISGESWKVRAGFSDRDIVRINPGDSASVTLDAWPGKTFPAEVKQISGIANPTTGTYEVELRLDDQGHRLAAGFIASVDVFTTTGIRSSVIPVGSLVDADGQTGYVYYVNKSGNVVRLKVTIVNVSGSEIAVTGIPAEVSEVVSEGASYLKDSVKVTVVN